MTHVEQRPLTSEELKQDQRAIRPDAQGGERRVGDESDSADHSDDDAGETRPNPLAGTMLPPD